MTAIKEIALPRDDKQNRIYYSTQDANERVKNKKHGNYLQWSDFFVYAFFDKIIQFLSKSEIRHLFSKKIGKIYTNCARTFYKYWLMKLRFWLIYFLKEHKNSATTFISIT